MPRTRTRIHVRQAVVLGVVWVTAAAAAVALTVTNTWGRVPWEALTAAAVALTGGSVSGFLGSVLRPESVGPETPTTPAAEAKRRHTETLRGEDEGEGT